MQNFNHTISRYADGAPVELTFDELWDALAKNQALNRYNIQCLLDILLNHPTTDWPVGVRRNEFVVHNYVAQIIRLVAKTPSFIDLSGSDRAESSARAEEFRKFSGTFAWPAAN